MNRSPVTPTIDGMMNISRINLQAGMVRSRGRIRIAVTVKKIVVISILDYNVKNVILVLVSRDKE